MCLKQTTYTYSIAQIIKIILFNVAYNVCICVIMTSCVLLRQVHASQANQKQAGSASSALTEDAVALRYGRAKMQSR